MLRRPAALRFSTLLLLNILLLAHLFKFSLLLLVEPRIDARGVRGPRGGRTVFEGTSVIRRWFPRTIRFPRVFESAVRRAGSARGHRATTVELARPRSGGNVWTTVVHGSQQSTVAAGGLLMLRLLGGHCEMTLVSSGLFLRGRTSGYSAPATVETDSVDRRVVVDDCRVVGIVHDGDVHVGDGTVIVERVASPVAAEKADTGVAETVVNAAIEADSGPPVARIPRVEAVFPSPVAWSPEQTDFRREYPRARNPEVAVRTISPIAGDPDIARARADGLRVNWQHWRSDPNGDANSNLCSGLSRDRQESNGEQERTNEASDTHNSHLSGVRWAWPSPTRSGCSPHRTAPMNKNPF